MLLPVYQIASKVATPHDAKFGMLTISGAMEDADTVEIDTGGVNRVYESDVRDGIRPGSDVAVDVSGPVPFRARHRTAAVRIAMAVAGLVALESGGYGAHGSFLQSPG